MPEQTLIDLRKQFSLPSQAETNYSPAGGVEGRACSSCRFYLRDGWDGVPVCHLIDNYPEPIEPNGLCDRHEVAVPVQVENLVPVPVVIVGEVEIEMEEMSLSVPRKMVNSVKEFVGNLLKPETLPPFQVFKAVNGRKAWVARHTGKWVDRESEIIADTAHDAYVKRVQSGVVPMPELWMGHAKGTRHGAAVAVWKSGGFVLAAGYLDDTPMGDKAFDYYQKHAGEITLSHMFHYPTMSKIDGVYYDYNTVEITTLLDGLEAFPYTSFQEIQTMAIPPVIQDMVRDALGADVLERALSMDKAAERDTKQLEMQGVASKYAAYDGTAVKGAEDELKAVKSALSAAEDQLKELKSLPGTVTQLMDQIKLLTEAVETKTTAENALLERLNALEKAQAEGQELQAPASKSNDALLNEREKTLLGQYMEAAKIENQKSIVEMGMDGMPTVST